MRLFQRVNPMIKKQYRYYETCSWKYDIITYHNGVKHSSVSMWMGDEMDKYIEDLESQGYTYGYLPDEVDDAKTIYEDMLANIISEDTIVGTPPNYTAGEYIINKGNNNG